MIDSILIVDDESGVRRTMADWLTQSGLPVTVTAVADAAAALVHANTHPIDLAILDWNLGTGSDGLRLLEDLVEFHPNLVAILVTGFAARATPLQALRMGVRDYLDKNAEFTRDVFLASVRKLLAQIAPVKKQRIIHEQHAAFRSAVEKILPLVRGAATLNEPVSLPDAVRSLLSFAIRSTGAADGVIVSYRRMPDGSERTFAFGADGLVISGPFPPFARTLAAAVHSSGRPSIITNFASLGPIDLQPFEQNRQSLLLVPLQVGSNLFVTIELFNKAEFTATDKATALSCAEIGTELVRHIVAERQNSRTLFDAVEAALRTTDHSANTSAVVEQMKQTIVTDSSHDSAETLPLLEAVRDLSQRHGAKAVMHCTTIIRDLATLLDDTVGVSP